MGTNITTADNTNRRVEPGAVCGISIVFPCGVGQMPEYATISMNWGRCEDGKFSDDNYHTSNQDLVLTVDVATLRS